MCRKNYVVLTCYIILYTYTMSFSAVNYCSEETPRLRLHDIIYIYMCVCVDWVAFLYDAIDLVTEVKWIVH